MTQIDAPARDVPTRLKRVLADRRMSGRQLATASGLTQAKVARILRGDRDLTVNELEQIARALEVAPADLLGPAAFVTAPPELRPRRPRARGPRQLGRSA